MNLLYNILKFIKFIVPDKLLLKSLNKTKKYTFPFKNYYVYVNEVVDGDTFHITFLMHGEPITLKLRLTGADAPEMSSKNGKEKQAAEAVTKYVRELLEHKYFYCNLKKWDKYGGRVVGSMMLRKDVSLTELLIKLRFAKPYEGSKKEVWKEDELNHIINTCKH